MSSKRCLAGRIPSALIKRAKLKGSKMSNNTHNVITLTGQKRAQGIANNNKGVITAVSINAQHK